MAEIVESGALWKDGQANILDVRKGTDMIVQSVGPAASGSYTVVARLTPNANFKPMSSVCKNEYTTPLSPPDDNIYVYDVCGLNAVSIQNVTGFAEVQAVIVNK